MSQIDRSMIVDMSEEVLDEFMCGICHEIFVDPMVTPCCRQTYCNACISLWLESHRTCPNDRRVLLRQQLTPPARAMINLFNSMKIKCKYHTNGCKTIVKVSEMGSHLKACAHNICEDCGLGRGSDEKHNCIENLKIKVESIGAENQRLNNQIKGLIEEIKRISDENRELKKSDLNPISFNSSTPRQLIDSRQQLTTFEDRSVNTLKDFMNGRFILESKYKTIDCGQRIFNRMLDITLEIIGNGRNFVFIQSQSGGTETIKRFILGQPFQWIRADGKCLNSVFVEFDRSSNPNQTRFIETVNDVRTDTRNALYRNLEHRVIYDFDVLTNHLTIEWTIGSIKKVEIYSRKL